MADGKVVISTAIDKSGAEKGLADLKSLVTKGVGAIAATAGIKEFVQGISEFGAGIAKASTLFDDINVQTSKLETNLLKLSNSAGISAISINEGLYQALSAGITVTEDMAESTQFLADSSKLAKAGFTEIPVAIEATAKTLNAYKMGVEETKRIQDILITTQNKGITTVAELGSVLSQVTPTAAAFKVSFEQVGASLASMTAQGIPTAQATTMLNQLIAELGKQGTKASEALSEAAKKAGLSQTSFIDMMNAGMSLDEVLNLLDDTAKNNGVSLLDMFSSIEAGKASLSLAGTNTQKYRDNLEAMKNSAGAVDKAYNIMADTIDFKSNVIATSFKNLAPAYGKAFEEPIKKLQDFLIGVLSDLTDLAPIAAVTFTAIGDLGQLTFEVLRKSYNGLKDDVNNFFEITGLDHVVQFVLAPFKGASENLTKFLETGEVKYLFGLAQNALTIGLELFVVKETFTAIASALTAGLGLGKGAYGALGLGALSVFFAFEEAKEEGDYSKFGQNLIAGIIAGLAVGGITGSVKAGAIAMGITFNFKIGESISELFKIKLDKSKMGEDVLDVLNDRFRSAHSKLVYSYEKGGAEAGKFFKQGLGLSLDDVKKLGKNEAENLLKAFNDALGIASPSKEAKKSGEFVTQGLELGMADIGNAGAEAATDVVTEFNSKLGNAGFKAGREYVSDYINGVISAPKAAQSIILKAGKDITDIKTKKEEPAIYDTDSWNKDYFKAMQQRKIDTDKNLSEWRKKNEEAELKAQEELNEKLIEQERQTLERRKSAVESASSVFLSGISNTVEAITLGENAWGGFAKAGLQAIASLLDALSLQLSAQAVEALFKKEWITAAKVGAGAAAAAVGAGLVRGWAGAFATGGIVKGNIPFTGQDNLLASVKAGEVILNHSQAINTAKLLESRQNQPIVLNFNGDVFGDKEAISIMIYDKVKSLQNEGRLNKW